MYTQDNNHEEEFSKKLLLRDTSNLTLNSVFVDEESNYNPSPLNQFSFVPKLPSSPVVEQERKSSIRSSMP